MFLAYYIFNIMLSILLVLHVYWTYLIFKVLYKTLAHGEVTFLNLSPRA
jgi:ceramide synthetase